MMLDIITAPTSNDAVLRVYRNECHLNEKAADLLTLSSKYRRLRFTTCEDSDGAKVYVASTDENFPGTFIPRRRGRSFRIYSTALCEALARNLEGYGTYRICPDVTKYCDNKIYYQIHLQKYD